MKPRILPLIVAAATFVVVGGTAPQSAAQDQPLGLPDVKMLAKNGVSDDVILSQIRNSHTVYRLSAAEIIDLKDAGVSQRVIDFMINTPTTSPGGPVVAAAPVAVSAPPPAATTMVVGHVGSEPPPVMVETVVGSPGPQYVWVAGYWRWHGRYWLWVPGAWVIPPRHGVMWVSGHWGRRFGRVVWVDGRWR
ncbi:MAG TPA: YXWGXW repeat-containing protein [Verrucomicrobiae bacterium]|nr:YXWGXW repeat-containing protein [Verrucomicrobiae bacterium]